MAETGLENLTLRMFVALCGHCLQRPFLLESITSHHLTVPASVAQSNARPTGDQEVAGSIPGNVLQWRLVMKYFLRSLSSFRCFKKGSCQIQATECAHVLVNHLKDKVCQEKCG